MIDYRNIFNHWKYGLGMTLLLNLKLLMSDNKLRLTDNTVTILALFMSDINLGVIQNTVNILTLFAADINEIHHKHFAKVSIDN